MTNNSPDKQAAAIKAWWLTRRHREKRREHAFRLASKHRGQIFRWMNQHTGEVYHVQCRTNAKIVGRGGDRMVTWDFQPDGAYYWITKPEGLRRLAQAVIMTQGEVEAAMGGRA